MGGEGATCAEKPTVSVAVLIFSIYLRMSWEATDTERVKAQRYDEEHFRMLLVRRNDRCVLLMSVMR